MIRTFIGLLIFVSGIVILMTHSNIQDIGLSIISIGGLFTIWFKLGSLESATKELERRICLLEDSTKRTIDELRELRHVKPH